MKTKYESRKLDWSKNELKALIKKLIDGNYHQTAEVVFDHIAHTGVETDLNPELKKKPKMEVLDDILGQFKKFDEEQTVISHRMIDHTDRIEKLEGKVFAS